MRSERRWIWRAAVMLAAVGLGELSCLRAAEAAPRRARGGLCATVSGESGAPLLAVLSAIPAELAPLVAAADVAETVTVEGRTYRIGRLGGVNVVLGLTGIGMVNAKTRTQSVVRHFRPAGIIVSGVAGSPRHIADVTVPVEWVEGGRRRAFGANEAMLELARQAAAVATPALQRCTVLSPGFGGGTVCLAHEPAIVIGGQGRTADPFAGMAAPCLPGGDDVFGCDVPSPAAQIGPGASAGEASAHAAVAAQAEDMETASVARAAAHRRVPYVAFRAVSDGAGDPLGLPGFPAQFFAYYRLASANAAASTIAFLERLAAVRQTTPSGERICRLLAKRQWHRAAGLLAHMPEPARR